MLDEPMLLLDAIRQAGIEIRAECGGRGVCGKCQIQLVKTEKEIGHTTVESSFFNFALQADRFHLACEVLADQNMLVYIPPESLISGQILQVEGEMDTWQSDPIILQENIRIKPPELNEPASISSRVLSVPGEPRSAITIDAERLLPSLLQQNNWSINLIKRNQVVFHATEKKISPPLGLAVDVGSTKIAC